MLVAIALPLLVGILYVAIPLICNLRFGRTRRRTLRGFKYQDASRTKPRTSFTRISGSETTSIDYRHSRSSISETIDVRKAINESAQSHSNVLMKKRNDLAAPPDPFNYFPQPSPPISSLSAQNRHVARLLPLSTPIEQKENSFQASPSLSSMPNSMQFAQSQFLSEQVASQSRVSSPSISGSRRKRPAHSASDLYKTPRISKSQRCAISSAPRASVNNGFRIVKVGPSDEFDLAEQIRHGEISYSEKATNSDISEVEMQDELTIEMPPESFLDSNVEKIEEHLPSPAVSEFQDAGKILDGSEPDLPHSDLFNNNRRISKIYPKRHLISDDTIFDDEEIRLKFQRNDKEVLDILQSYAS